MIIVGLLIYVGWQLIKGFTSGSGKESERGPSHRRGTHASAKHNKKFMGLFGRKKKQEPHYDPNHITLQDLRVGFMFDYDLSTWIIKEEYEYDWGNNYFTREYMINNGEKTAYLHIDQDNELFITISEKLKIRVIDENLPEEIVENERPPKKLVFKGVTYYLDKESPGYFSDDPEDDESWTELVAWDYYDEKEQLTLGIEQWGEREFEASFGKVVQEFEISNILPGSN